MNKKLKEVILATNDLLNVVSQNSKTSAESFEFLLNQNKTLAGQVSKAQSEVDKIKNQLNEDGELLNDIIGISTNFNSEIKDLKKENEYITQFIGLLIEHFGLDLEVIEPSCKLVSNKKQKTVKKTAKPKKSKKK